MGVGLQGRRLQAGGGLDPAQPRWLCNLHTVPWRVQSSRGRGSWGLTSQSPKEEGKAVGGVLVREEADPYRMNF